RAPNNRAHRIPRRYDVSGPRQPPRLPMYYALESIRTSALVKSGGAAPTPAVGANTTAARPTLPKPPVRLPLRLFRHSQFIGDSNSSERRQLDRPLFQAVHINAPTVGRHEHLSISHYRRHELAEEEVVVRYARALP